MSTLEIVLLVAGAVIFIISFLLPGGKPGEAGENKELVREDIKEMIAEEIGQMKDHVDDVVGESIDYAVEKTERSLERLSNEKIMAVNEYSDTVLEEINRNHKEVMFLYDMLNDKHQNIKETINEMSKAVKEAEESLKQKSKESDEIIIKPYVPENIADNSKNKEGVFRTINGPKIPKPPLKQSPEMNGPAGIGSGVGAIRGRNGEDGRNLQGKSADRQEEVPALSAVHNSPDNGTGMEISFIQDAAVNGHNFNDRILELHKQGKSKVSIAKELGLGVGEVKLVIDLYKGI